MLKNKAIKEKDLFSVIDAGAISSSITTINNFIPVLYLDYEDNPQFENLIEVHEDFRLGDVKTTWAKDKDDKNILFLELEFIRPSSLTITIKFELNRQFSIVDSIASAKCVYLQSKKLNKKKLSQSLDEERILVEIPNEIDMFDWGKLKIDLTIKKFVSMGYKKKEAIRMAEEYWGKKEEITTLFKLVAK